MCFKVDSERLSKGFDPYILLKKCKGEKCKSSEEIKKLLMHTKIYAITLTDTSDYTHSTN